jgi:hypothetical protein
MRSLNGVGQWLEARDWTSLTSKNQRVDTRLTTTDYTRSAMYRPSLE